MWLTAKLFLGVGKEGEVKKIKEKIKKITKSSLEPESVTFRVFEWRKANAIHKWFVDNVQDGNDDCRTYYVAWEQLHKLLETINKVLGVNDKEKIANKLSKNYNTEFLPTTEGSFFGSTEYDKDYIQDLEDTKEVLEQIFKNEEEYAKLDFEYGSSW